MASSSRFGCLAKILIAITLLATCLTFARFAMFAYAGFPTTHATDSENTKSLIDELNLPFGIRIDSHKSYLNSPRYRCHYFKILTTEGVPEGFFNYESTFISKENFEERHQSIWPDLNVSLWSESGDIYWRGKTVKYGNVEMFFCKKSNVLFVLYVRY